MRRVAHPLVIAAAFTLLSSGCVDAGSTGASGGSASVPDGSGELAADPQDAVGVLESYFAAIANGDEAACDLESSAYTRTANEEFGAFAGETTDCPERIWQTQGMLIAFDQDFVGAVYTVRESSTSSEATVDVSYPDGTEETYVLVRKDGEWLVDDNFEAPDADRSSRTDD